MNIYEKLQVVQENLHAPKSQYNSFGRYSYRNCEDILEAAKPILAEVKAVLLVGDELLQVGERYYIKATATLIDCESAERSEVSNVAYAREELEVKGMSTAQVTGSTSSYARKYALNGLLCIDDNKDADTRDNRASGQAKTEPKTEKIGEKELKTLRDYEKKYNGEHNLTEQNFCRMYKVSRLEDLTPANFADLLKKIKAFEGGEE